MIVAWLLLGVATTTLAFSFSYFSGCEIQWFAVGHCDENENLSALQPADAPPLLQSLPQSCVHTVVSNSRLLPLLPLVCLHTPIDVPQRRLATFVIVSLFSLIRWAAGPLGRCHTLCEDGCDRLLITEPGRRDPL